MSGADLSNLINEAALIAVREGDKKVHNTHLEQARDRVLMGQTREATVLNSHERERVASIEWACFSCCVDAECRPTS